VVRDAIASVRANLMFTGENGGRGPGTMSDWKTAGRFRTQCDTLSRNRVSRWQRTWRTDTDALQGSRLTPGACSFKPLRLTLMSTATALVPCCTHPSRWKPERQVKGFPFARARVKCLTLQTVSFRSP
jgi:hypothetical protein